MNRMDPLFRRVAAVALLGVTVAAVLAAGRAAADEGQTVMRPASIPHSKRKPGIRLERAIFPASIEETKRVLGLFDTAKIRRRTWFPLSIGHERMGQLLAGPFRIIDSARGTEHFAAFYKESSLFHGGCAVLYRLAEDGDSANPSSADPVDCKKISDLVARAEVPGFPDFVPLSNAGRTILRAISASNWSSRESRFPFTTILESKESYEQNLRNFAAIGQVYSPQTSAGYLAYSENLALGLDPDAQIATVSSQAREVNAIDFTLLNQTSRVQSVFREFTDRVGQTMVLVWSVSGDPIQVASVSPAVRGVQSSDQLVDTYQPGKCFSTGGAHLCVARPEYSPTRVMLQGRAAVLSVSQQGESGRSLHLELRDGSERTSLVYVQ